MAVANSSIEWTDSTWSPLTGCTKVSPGCAHCYAETMHERFNGKGSFATVTLRPDRLDQPLRWRKPRRIFVNSMSDLFHQEVPDSFILRVWEVMARTPQHTYQILTKRHARMRSFTRRLAFGTPTGEQRRMGISGRVPYLFSSAEDNWDQGAVAPLDNVWLGVSVEDQQRADLRIQALLDTPAAVRWISAEPLLGPVDLRSHFAGHCPEHDFPGGFCVQRHHDGVQHLDWVVAGGESGRGARPMHPDWARGLRDQAAAAGVPFLFKQWGEHTPYPSLLESATRDAVEVDHGPGAEPGSDDPPAWMWRVGKRAAGRELDGRTWDQYPTGGAGGAGAVSVARIAVVPA